MRTTIETRGESSPTGRGPIFAWATSLLLFGLPGCTGALLGESGSGGGGPGGGGPGGGGPGGTPGPGVAAILVPISVPGTTYYVDADNGDNEADGLTRATAWKTLAAATNRISRSGGDKLVLRGVFREVLRIARVNNPSAGQPNPALPTVAQCDFDASGAPLEARVDGGITGAASFPFDKRGLPEGFGPGTGNYLTRGVIVTDSNHVTISGIDVRGIAGQGVSSWKSSHLRFEHMRIEWTAESAMLLTNGGFNEPDARDLTVAHCRINQANLGAWGNESAGTGYNMSSEMLSVVQFDGFDVYANHLSNSAKEGIAIKVDARNGSVRHNLVENARSVGIYCTEIFDTRIFRNIVRHIGYYDPQDGSGLQLAAPYLSSKVPFSFNAAGATGILIGNGDFGPAAAFEKGRVSGVHAFENEVSWTLKQAITVNNEWRTEGKTGWLVDDIQVLNNVAYRSCQGMDPGAAAIQIDFTATNSAVINNIVARSAKRGIVLTNPLAGSFFASNSISNNLFHSNFHNGEEGASARFGDPLFVTTPGSPGAAADFQVRLGSPAIDSGFVLALLTTGGTAPDIGAYQFSIARWLAGIGVVL